MKIDPKLEKDLILVLRCALADLQGAHEAHVTGAAHNWKTHRESTKDVARILKKLTNQQQKEQINEHTDRRK